MTCPRLLRRPASSAGTDGDEQRRPQQHDEFNALVGRLRRDDTPAQFSRFVLVGGSSSLLYAALYVLLSGFGGQLANIIASVVSTIVANEMHRRLTFHAGERVTWFTAQWEGWGIAVLGLTATTLALTWLEHATDSSDVVTELAVVGAVTATIGTLRFIALRWLFAPPARTSVTPQTPSRV